MFELIDRRRVQAESRAVLRDAQVSPLLFFAAYLGVKNLLQLGSYLATWLGNGGSLLANPAELFMYLFASLFSPILLAGTFLYAFAIRRKERAELSVLFDGLSFTGKLVGLYLLEALFIFLWMLLFIIPGLIAIYRYRFAYINLCKNPTLSPLDALNLSKAQTRGYKFQLFQLDLSYFAWSFMSMLPSTLLSAFVMDPEQVAAISMSPLYIAADLGFFFVFSLVYLPNLTVSLVAYHETAVRTSGADPHRGFSGDTSVF